MRRYDLQVHTDASPCSRAKPQDIVDAALDAELDGIAVTDHDTLDGYEAMKGISSENLTLIPGVEVTTTQGHLLALNVKEVPPKADPLTVINSIHDQGGIAVLSHPFDKLREHYAENISEIAEVVDGVEVTNSRCVFPWYNKEAQSFANKNNLAVTGGSDAHFPTEVGRAYTMCEGSVLEEIREGTTQAGGRGGYVSGHVATKINDILSMMNL